MTQCITQGTKKSPVFYESSGIFIFIIATNSRYRNNLYYICAEIIDGKFDS